MSPLRKRWIEVGCLVLGVVILGVTVARIGLAELFRDLQAIGWGLAFPAGERTVSPRRLLAARLAGDGVNYLTPSATVGGELLRVRLLGSRMPLGVRWASVSVAKLGQTVAQALFIFLGLALVLPRIADVTPLAAALGGGAAALLVALGFGWLLRRGVYASLEGLAARVGLAGKLPARWARPGRELDAALGRLAGPRLAASLTCFVAGWAVGAAEIYLILHWLHAPVDWQMAVALETGSVLIDGILFFVPAKIGTQEGGKVVLFAALGLNPARGLTVGVVRRIRELAYAGVGLAALGALSAHPVPSRYPALARRSES